MAGKTTKFRAWRTLITLFVLIGALYGVIAAATHWSDGAFTPKLALDLEGGTEIVLTPVLEGGRAPSATEINQAIEIIRQRIDASGVSEAEITSQGGTNIVVALPGQPSEETLQLVRQSAQMRFRPVLRAAATTGYVTPNSSWLSYDPTNPLPTPSATDASGSDSNATAIDIDGDIKEQVTEAMSFDQVSDEIKSEFENYNCFTPGALIGTGGEPADKPLVTCSQDGYTKYLLGPVIIAGSQITAASSGLETTSQGGTTGKWEVRLSFDSDGTKVFSEATTQMYGYISTDADATSFWGTATDVFQGVPDRNHFAAVLDGIVITSPGVNVAIPNGSASISGSFNRDSANALANKLSFGSLPVTFKVESEQQISATLGSEQLEKGMLAGVIGLALVALYSLLQYRALGGVTILALVLAAGTSYGLITMLSWAMDYRLSLPGVAGLIVSVGITADSFIVYFERIKDELRDGRLLTQSVDMGWKRARRTILASDFVSFLAAVVLYFLAVGGVRGFAFTLGLTTLVDLIIVFMFTHPVVTLLARTRFFGGGHPASGLDPHTLGAEGAVHYRGRGQFATAKSQAMRDARREPTTDANGRKLTIAERRAAAIEETAEASPSEPSLTHRSSDSDTEGGER